MFQRIIIIDSILFDLTQYNIGNILNKIGKNNAYNVWSSVFAPYENPEIVLVVTAEDVNGLGAVTLPVAHDVLKWYFSKDANVVK